MKKLLSRRGETLIETMVAILVLALIFLFLAKAVAAGAQINARAAQTDVSFHYASSDDEGEELDLEVKRSDGSTERDTVRSFSTSPDADGAAQYHYYTYES